MGKKRSSKENPPSTQPPPPPATLDTATLSHHLSVKFEQISSIYAEIDRIHKPDSGNPSQTSRTQRLIQKIERKGIEIMKKELVYAENQIFDKQRETFAQISQVEDAHQSTKHVLEDKGCLSEAQIGEVLKKIQDKVDEKKEDIEHFDQLCSEAKEIYSLQP